ncbi:hypothetical protein TNCV_4607151 [Trichonephila clavipes]|nr:hypothetical protein TNCV_4607151 [Trichonephila clavipes]
MVANHSGIVTEWAGLVSSQIKPVEVSRVGPIVASLPWLSEALGFLDPGSIFVNECENNAHCYSEGQGDFRLRRLGSLLGSSVGSLIAGDHNTGPFVKPQPSHMR